MFLTRIALKKTKINSILKQSKKLFCQEESKVEDPEVIPESLSLPKFEESELTNTPISEETLIKGYFPLKKKLPETYKILKSEIENLTSQNRLYRKLKEESEILKKVNDENHKKLVMMVERLKNSEKETESVQNRLMKQVEKEKNFAITKFAGNSLEILDNFDRCFLNLDENDEKNEAILKSDFYEGVKITYNSAQIIFRRNNIFEMTDLEGTVADFDKHEAVFVAPFPGKEENEILSVMEKGYVIGERVLRNAKVGVVKNN